MISTRKTAAQDEEEGAYEERGREEGATKLVRAALEGATHGSFAVSCAALRRIDSLLIAPMT